MTYIFILFFTNHYPVDINDYFSKTMVQKKCVVVNKFAINYKVISNSITLFLKYRDCQCNIITIVEAILLLLRI